MRKAVYVTAIIVIIFLIQPIAQVTVVDANPFSSLSLGDKISRKQSLQHHSDFCNI